ncbi:MAG: hypothetical protein ABSD29_20940 [Verrucomicrobiota bacterium]|jgi:hypothetical protein
MQSNSATIEIAQPRLFTAGAVAVVNAYGILLAAPLVMAILVVSLIKFGILTILIPFLVVAATAYFLPFGLGNTHVTRLVHALNPAAGKSDGGFIVQLTLSPRIRSGLLAILEDADDIGYLSFSATELVFEGDSVKLTVPLDRIEQVRPQNIGLRGLFVYGRRIRVVVSGLPQIRSFEFAERSSRVLPTSRAITRKLCERLSTKVPPATAQGLSAQTLL